MFCRQCVVVCRCRSRITLGPSSRWLRRKILAPERRGQGRLALRRAVASSSGRPLVMMALVGLLAFNFAVILPVLAKKTFHGTGEPTGSCPPC